MAFKLLGEVTDETAPVEAPSNFKLLGEPAAPAPQKGTLETAKDFITAPLGKGPLAGFTEKVPAAPLEMAMPGGMMAQTIGQGVLGAGKEAAAGGGPLSIGMKGVEGAVGGLTGGLIGKGIGKATTALGGLGRYSEDIGSQIATKLKELGGAGADIFR